MHIAAHNESVAKRLASNSCKPLFRIILLVAAVFGIVAHSPTAYAANPISYTISPATGAYNSGSNAELLLSIKTTTAIAGASVKVDLSNATLASFNTANSPAFILVDYHEEQRDVVVICQNNNCPPGTYPVAKLNLTAGQAGSMKLTLTHVEAADPSLNPLSADGGQYSYTVNHGPAGTGSTGTGTTPRRSTFTVPGTGSGPTIVPNEVTADELAGQESEAIASLRSNTPAGKSDDKSSSSSPIKNLFIGFGVILLVSMSFLAGRGFRSRAAYGAHGYSQYPPSSDTEPGLIHPASSDTAEPNDFRLPRG